MRIFMFFELYILWRPVIYANLYVLRIVYIVKTGHLCESLCSSNCIYCEDRSYMLIFMFFELYILWRPVIYANLYVLRIVYIVKTGHLCESLCSSNCIYCEDRSYMLIFMFFELYILWRPVIYDNLYVLRIVYIVKTGHLCESLCASNYIYCEDRSSMQIFMMCLLRKHFQSEKRFTPRSYQ